jgi:peptide/nickel transport system substrate-binding protein
MEFEAVPDYWRKAPQVKTVVIKGVPEMTTRVALLKTGEVDAAHQLQGVLLQQLRKEGTYRLGAVRSAATWLELGALDSPDHPLKELKVRQAVSLALDRQAINEAELDGMSPIEGNWVPEDYQGAVKRPVQQVDLAQAKKLLAEAGVGDGFEVSALTPLPPYFSWAERIISQLRAVNIKTQVNTMERAAFYDKLAPGPNRQKGLVLQFSGAPGDAAARIRENAVCKGAFSGLCLPEVDERMQRFEASVDPQERQKLLEEVQNFLLDQYYMIPMVRNVAVWGFGPRIANKIEEINGSISQYPFLGPWEDIQVKD